MRPSLSLASANENQALGGESVAWLRISPFVALHLACLAPIWIGVAAPRLVPGAMAAT